MMRIKMSASREWERDYGSKRKDIVRNIAEDIQVVSSAPSPQCDRVNDQRGSAQMGIGTRLV
jgi:hypothetical protein